MAAGFVAGVRVNYTLAVPVALSRATSLATKTGTWLGDLGNAEHLWNGGVPAAGKRHGDHTPWSSDGPAGVVKAFDWHPDDPARFRTWWIAALKSGRYGSTVKFSNLEGRQYGPRGQDQGSSTDEHLHCSFQPGAVNSKTDIIADYLAAMNTPTTSQGDDVDPSTAINQPADVGLPGQTPGTRISGKTLAWLMWAQYAHILATEAAVKAGAAADASRDAALQALVSSVLSAGGGNLDTAAVVSAIDAATEKTRAAVVEAARTDLKKMAAALTSTTP